MCSMCFCPTCPAILPCGTRACTFSCPLPPECCQACCPSPSPCTPCPPCICKPVYRPCPAPVIPDLVPPIVPMLPACRPRRIPPVEPLPYPSPKPVCCPPALPCCPRPEPCDPPPVSWIKRMSDAYINISLLILCLFSSGTALSRTCTVLSAYFALLQCTMPSAYTSQATSHLSSSASCTLSLCTRWTQLLSWMWARSCIEA